VGEKAFVSAIALAVNVGDYNLLDALLGYLEHVDMDEGLLSRTANPSGAQNDQPKELVRRITPL